MASMITCVPTLPIYTSSLAPSHINDILLPGYLSSFGCPMHTLNTSHTPLKFSLLPSKFQICFTSCASDLNKQHHYQPRQSSMKHGHHSDSPSFLYPMGHQNMSILSHVSKLPIFLQSQYHYSSSNFF